MRVQVRIRVSLTALLSLIGLVTVLASPIAFAQSGSPARRIISGPTLPTTCLSSVLIRDAFYKTGSGAGIYICTAGPGTWTQQSSSGSAMSVSMGGTGQTSLTLNNVLLGNGTSAVQFVAPGTSGNVLTSDGTTWASSTPTTSIGGSTGSVDNTILRADGTGGSTVQGGSLVTITDTGWVAGDGGKCYVATDQTNATTTMASTTCTISGLAASTKYRLICTLFLDESAAADGYKIDFAGGSATETNFRSVGQEVDNAGSFNSQINDDLTDVFSVAVTAGGDTLIVNGAFEPSGAGTLIPRFAQNAHTTGTVTLLRGSNCRMEIMP